MEWVVHELLESSWGITETKEHGSQFKESFMHDEGHFPLVTIFDTNIVIPLLNIELGKMMSVFEFID